MDKKSIEEENARIELQLGKLLRLGILLSVAFMLVGLILFLGNSQASLSPDEVTAFNLMDYVSSHSVFDPVTIMLMGCFMLILTPIFRVLATLIIFFITKDRLYVLFTTVVLVIIAISIVLGSVFEPK